MRAELALAVLALAGHDRAAQRRFAVDTLARFGSQAAGNLPAWWRWTVWLAVGIGAKRIEAA